MRLGALIFAALLLAGNAQAQSVHNAVVVPSGLVGWWTGDATGADATGDNPGRLLGNARYAAGMVGEGFLLPDGQSYLKVAATTLDVAEGPGFSIELWINPADLMQTVPVAGWSGTSTPGVCLSLAPGKQTGRGRLVADLRDRQGASHRFSYDGADVLPNVFQHVALTYDRVSRAARLYLNAHQVAERVVPRLSLQTGYDFYCGKHLSIDKGNTMFRGSMDEVSLYNRALKSAEVKAIWAAGSAGKRVLTVPGRLAADEQRRKLDRERLKSFMRKYQGAALTCRALIDGSDSLHIKGDRVWYEHHDFSLPGLPEGANEPTQINLADWMPEWQGALSKPLTGLHPALPSAGHLELALDVLETGGAVSIRQLPAASNEYEAVLYLDDNEQWGAHWCQFCLGWVAAGTRDRPLQRSSKASILHFH